MLNLESRIKAAVRWSPLHPSYIARRGLRKVIRKHIHKLRGTLLDLGCDRQPYRQELSAQVDRYIATDFEYRLGVDFLSSATHIPLADESVDSILMTEVLEHVSDPFLAMSEAFRILRKDGKLLLTTPQTWGLHGEPHDYYRFTQHGLRHVLAGAGFKVEVLEPYSGTIGTAGARLADGWAEYVLPRRSIPVSKWGWRTGLVVIGVAVWLPINIVFPVLDSVFRLRYDPIGHLVIASKPGDAQP